jgi:hypothetical protein
VITLVIIVMVLVYAAFHIAHGHANYRRGRPPRSRQARHRLVLVVGARPVGEPAWPVRDQDRPQAVTRSGRQSSPAMPAGWRVTAVTGSMSVQIVATPSTVGRQVLPRGCPGVARRCRGWAGVVT